MRKNSLVILAAVLSVALCAGVQIPPVVAAAVPAPQSPTPADDAVLYGQSGDYGSDTVPSQSSINGHSLAADDFSVSAADGWTVTGVRFAIYYNLGLTGDARLTYNVDVYRDAGGVPDDSAAPLCSAQDVEGSRDGLPFATVTVALPVPCLLPQGSYWVALQGNLDGDTSLPYAPSMSIRAYVAAPLAGHPAVWKSSSQQGCTNWAPLSDCGFADNALGFEVIGTAGGGNGNGLDLKVTVAPDNGDPAQCGTQTRIDTTVGDKLNVCYTVSNHAGRPFAYHTLTDSLGGTLFSVRPYDLEDGASYQFNRIITAEQAENGYLTAAWTANDPRLAGYDADTSGPSQFVDISATGSELGDIGDDGSRVVNLPFPITYYGATTSTIGVSNNGAVLIGGTRPVNAGNTALPNMGAVFDMPALFPLWDDFDATAGGVYYATLGAAPNRQFVVEWFNRPHNPGSQNASDTATFEVIFDEASGTFSYEYADVAYTANGSNQDSPVCDGGACATIGLQQDATYYTQYSFNTASVSDGTSIVWRPRVVVPVTSTAAVALVIGAPKISVAPGALIRSTPRGTTTTALMSIGNTGNRDLSWNIDAAADAANPLAHFPLVPYVAPVSRASDDAQRLNATPFADTATPGLLPDSILSALAPFEAAGVPAFAMGGYGPEGGIHPSQLVYFKFDAANPSQLQGLSGLPIDMVVGGAFVNNDFGTEYIINRGGSLSAYDTSTGASTYIGFVGVTGVWSSDLAWDPTTQTLYETLWVPGDNISYLYQVDYVNGTSTQVAKLDGVLLISAAFDTTGHMYGIDLLGSQLIAIDKRNGDWHGIGPLGFRASATANIDFDPRTGVLWMAAHPDFNPALNPVPAIYTVDTATGHANQLALVAESVDLTALAIAAPYTGCTEPATIPWLSLTQDSGRLTGGSSVQLTATFDARSLVAGSYSAQLCVRSDDLSRRIVGVPVTFTVTPGANQAPVAQDDAYSVVADSPFTAPAPGVLANDTDADGDALTAVLGSSPAHGTLALSADGGFTYTPATGFTGTDTFTYQASDGQQSSASATVTLTIQPAVVADNIFKDGFDDSAP